MGRKDAEPSTFRQSPAGRAEGNGSGILDAGPNSDDAASADFHDEAEQPVGARPSSAITARPELGTGGGETEDGLSESEEATREAAEGVRDEDQSEIPVFDEAETPPSVWKGEDESDGEDEDEDEDDES